MPGFDGTGPRGQGAMTGGGRGYCAIPLNEVGKSIGTRRFFGRGGGRGWRNCFYAGGLPCWMRAQRGMRAFGGFGQAVSPEDEVTLLKSEADYLKQQLEETQARIQVLEKEQESGPKE